MTSDRRLDRTLRILCIFALSLLLFWIALVIVDRIKVAVVILMGAAFFAYLIYPAVAWLEKRGAPRWAAVALVYACLVAVFALSGAFVAPRIGAEVRTLTLEAPVFATQLRETLVNANANILAAVPPESRTMAANYLDQVLAQAQREGTVLGGRLSGMLLSAASVLTALVIIPFLALYLLLDLERLRDSIARLVPAKGRGHFYGILEDVDSVVGGFIRGQLLVGAIIAVIVTIMLTLLQIKYAFLIGIFAGIVDIVPYVGAVAGAIPAFGIALFTHGPLWALLVAACFLVMYELEGHFIAPWVVGKRVGLTPLMVIVAVLIGAELGGIAGMFIAVPIAAFGRVLLIRYLRARDGELEEPEAGVTRED